MAMVLSQITRAHLRQLSLLCKWRVVCLMLLTSMIGMAMVPIDYWQIRTCVYGLVGIGLSACSGGILNQAFEKDLDAKMSRTSKRPIVQAEIPLKNALWLATAFMLLSILILYFYVNPLTCWLTTSTMFGYSVIYTKILKPLTCQNIVIGGLFGAMPPLLGWTTLTNTISALPLIMVAIIFTWTPPHFWSLALTKISDYEESNLPMLPITHGIRCTQIHILAYTVLLILMTQMPILLRFSHSVYGIGVNLLNLIIFLSMYRVYQSPSHENCMQAFKNSNLYLLSVFVILFLDHLIC